MAMVRCYHPLWIAACLLGALCVFDLILRQQIVSPTSEGRSSSDAMGAIEAARSPSCECSKVAPGDMNVKVNATATVAPSTEANITTFVTSLSQPCSFSERRKHVMDTCSEVPEAELKRHRAENPNFYAMIIDHQSKVVYCRIGKSGSTAAVRYFRSFNTKDTTGFSDMPRFVWNETSKEQRSELKGFQYFENMPAAEFDKYYSGYKKILFVRHPLQRVVSSFFFSCIRNHKPQCRKKTNFTEFVRDIILQTETLAPIIYRKHHLACHPCDVKYDVIVRTETTEYDMPNVNDEIGADESHALPYVQINTVEDFESDYEATHYKYNEYLSQFEQEHPELFQQMLEHFALDFQMFGYTWENHRSGCVNKFSSCC